MDGGVSPFPSPWTQAESASSPLAAKAAKPVVAFIAASLSFVSSAVLRYRLARERRAVDADHSAGGVAGRTGGDRSKFQSRSNRHAGSKLIRSFVPVACAILSNVLVDGRLRPLSSRAITD